MLLLALKKSPDKIVFKFLLTIIFLTLLNGCSSLSPLSDATKSHHVAKAYKDRGMARLVLEDSYKDAIRDFTMAIEFYPEDAGSYVNRGLAYSKTGDKESARKDFKKAISLDSELKKVLRPFLR